MDKNQRTTQLNLISNDFLWILFCFFLPLIISYQRSLWIGSGFLHKPIWKKKLHFFPIQILIIFRYWLFSAHVSTFSLSSYWNYSNCNCTDHAHRISYRRFLIKLHEPIWHEIKKMNNFWKILWLKVSIFKLINSMAWCHKLSLISAEKTLIKSFESANFEI